jgi:hypothetical protein
LNRLCEFSEKISEDFLAYTEKLETENARLKRLDENVKRKIEAAKNSDCFGWVFDYEEYIDLLESLYK